jgi:hypothetical protein
MQMLMRKALFLRMVNETLAPNNIKAMTSSLNHTTEADASDAQFRDKDTVRNVSTRQGKEGLFQWERKCSF